MDEAVETLVREHVSLHPNLGIRDVYKLLFQGVMGVAHILGDREGAWRRLVEEFEGLDASEFLEEPLLERVSVDGCVVRVNLRAFKRSGLPLEGLFEVMLMSAERIGADQERFVRLWNRFVDLVKAGKLDFDYEALMKFDGKVKDMDYPLVRHSGKYVETDKPAYRVVEKKGYEEMFR